MSFRFGFVLSLGLLVGPVAAQESELLFSNQAWKVEVTQFEDGTKACKGEVVAEGESFSIWALQAGGVRLQFFSEQWDFGEGQTADLVVEIDRRGPWSLMDAELYLNSILFDLPDGAGSAGFIREVSNGSTIYLRAADGEDMRSYPLAGSSAAIDALIDCEDMISENAPSDPLN